jgi:glutamine synthetase
MTTLLEYVWLGGNGELRSKTKVHLGSFSSLRDVPPWDYDGSSTGQAFHKNTEVELIPVKMFKNPFVPGFLVLCETFVDGKPHPSNHRWHADAVFDQRFDDHIWFGLEQEYFMLSEGWAVPRNSSYCAVGNRHAIERKIAESHLRVCLETGLAISGINAEVAACQWEFQIGPCEGIEAADQLIVARYLLERIAESHEVSISYAPKLYSDVNGSGCHTNFSTSKTRAVNGLAEIYKCVDKLEKAHERHMAVYGVGNEARLTGFHETASYKTFSSGVGTRHTSVRIGTKTEKEGKGYFEDRRPAANMDPYLVTAIMAETCC